MTPKRKPARPRGRPPIAGERMPSRSLALPADLWRELDDQAHDLRVSTSELIRRLIARALARSGRVSKTGS